MSSDGNLLLDSIEDVDIDDSGRFKYILIKIWPLNDEKTFKYIVRGYKWAGYHGKISLSFMICFVLYLL